MNTMPLEEDTRVLINRNLENLGWKLSGEERNVYLEQPRSELEKKKLGGKRPDYVLYSKESEKPLIIIEAKKKGARIDTALEQGIDYAKTIEAPLVFATDGVFCKAFHTIANRTPILNGEEIDEFIREALALRYLNTYEVNTISPKVQYDRKELIRIFDEANNMLRGEGLRAGIERFGEFANILFLKLVSENEQIKRESGIQSNFDISCSWESIKNIVPTARIDYINNTVFRRLNALYKTEIFTPLEIHDERILKGIMDKLDPLVLTDVDSDVKGDAFEYFLKSSTATKNDLGEYFTPRHIVKTMVRLVNPRIGEKIYDPFCGTGGFLIESFRHIERNMASGNKKLQEILRKETVYGNEITPTARIAKMNMILAGDGHSNITRKDSLSHPTYIDKIKYDEKGNVIRDKEGNIEYTNEYKGIYDVVITNMPYSQKTEYGNLYDLPNTNGDSICVQHCMKSINSASENGRMALVVPEGFLFRKDLTKTREYLLENCQLQSIISLPQGVFLPYTGVKTDIIYATKVNQKSKISKRPKEFWYFDVKSDGYTLDNHRRKLKTSSDLSKYEEYRKLDKDQKDDMLKVGFEIISLDKVRQNSNILVGSRYRTTMAEKTAHQMISLGDEKYFTIYSGGTPSSTVSEYWNGSVNWITLADLSPNDFITEIKRTERTISKLGLDNSNAKLLPLNTVVVSTRATIGRVGITRTELATNQGFKNIVIKNPEEILPEYLAYILTVRKDAMLHLASGATFKEISKENFGTIQIPLISIEQQRKLVSELDGYRQIVDGAQNIIKNYSPHLPILRNYKIVKLSDVCKINLKSVNPAQEYGNDTFTYIDISSVEGGTGKISKTQTIEGVYAPSRARRRFSKGDILLSMVRPNLKAFSYIDFEADDFVASTGFAVLTPQNINGKYLFYMLLDDYVGSQLIGAMSKAMYPSVNKSDLENLNILYPSMEEQEKIVQQIEKEISLVKPSGEIISTFNKKIEDKLKEVWGE